MKLLHNYIYLGATNKIKFQLILCIYSIWCAFYENTPFCICLIQMWVHPPPSLLQHFFQIQETLHLILSLFIKKQYEAVCHLIGVPFSAFTAPYENPPLLHLCGYDQYKSMLTKLIYTL